MSTVGSTGVHVYWRQYWGGVQVGNTPPVPAATFFPDCLGFASAVAQVPLAVEGSPIGL